MTKLVCFVILLFVSNIFAILIHIRINQKTNKCLADFVKNYVKFIVNIVLNFNYTNQSYLRVIRGKPYYYIEKESFSKLLEILNSTQETPNSFTFLFPTLNKLNQSLNAITKSQIFYILARYLVLLNDRVNGSAVAELLFNYKLYNSVIIVTDETTAYFYAIYSRGEKSKVKTIGNCDQVKMSIFKNIRKFSQLYPRNTSLYAIWSQHIPFIIYEENRTLTGIKIDALKAFKHASPIKLVYRPPDLTFENELYASYTFNSVQESFQSNYADWYTGSGDINIGKYFDVGPIIFYNVIYFFVPRPLRNSFLDTILSLMSLKQWVLSFFCFIIWIIVFTNLSKLSVDSTQLTSYSRSLLIFYNFLLGYGYNLKKPRSFAVRILIVSFLCMTLQLTTLIQGELVSIITGSQYRNPITNLDELLTSRLPVKLADAVFKAFPNASDPSVIKLRNSYISKNIDMFILENECIRDKNFAAVTDTGFLIMHPRALETHSIFYLMGSHQIFAMPRNHYLHKHFFDRLERIIESGIIDKFVKLYTFKYSLAGEQEPDKRDFKLTISILSGVYIILLIGHCIALVALASEIVFFKLKNVKYDTKKKFELETGSTGKTFKFKIVQDE